MAKSSNPAVVSSRGEARPPPPLQSRVRQTELDWSSSIVLGFPPESRGLTLFMAPSIDVPIWSGDSSYTCVGCDIVLEDYQPGIRVGGMIGMAFETD